MTPEFVFDDGQTDDNAGSATHVRQVVVGLTAILAIVIGILIAVHLLSEPAPQEGAHVRQAEIILLERPAVDGWELLVPLAGELSSEFPPPMVWRADRVCIGFARVDFGPDNVRPSLARCERSPAEDMAVNEIRSLVSVKTGFDTWHFIEAADRIDSIEVLLTARESLNGDRIHLSGSTAALRLENGRDLASMQWSTQDQTYRCVPDPTAWQTSEFCTEPDDESDG